MAGKGLSLLQLKIRAEAKEEDEKQKASRRRNILVLVLDHLMRHGYIGALEKLTAESGVSLSKWCVADNIDLMTVFEEFETYFNMKFSKLPKFVRANAAGAGANANGAIGNSAGDPTVGGSATAAAANSERGKKGPRRSTTAGSVPDSPSNAGGGGGGGGFPSLGGGGGYGNLVQQPIPQLGSGAGASSSSSSSSSANTSGSGNAIGASPSASSLAAPGAQPPLHNSLRRSSGPTKVGDRKSAAASTSLRLYSKPNPNGCIALTIGIR